ncbi:COP9 signalosome complex subunit 5 [Sarotherodon galilaeus]
MCTEHSSLKLTLTLFFGGVLCSKWNVDYRQPHMCVVKGSSVVILCSFSYPDKHVVQEVMWGHNKNIFAGPFIYHSGSNNSSSRFQYVGNKRNNCSLQIHQVEHSDEGKYAFRFTTNSTEGQWTGKSGSTLKIVDFNISMTKLKRHESIQEGDSVNLTCTDRCDAGNFSSVFTWFKNGEYLQDGRVLQLGNVSFTNSGNYTCSLKTSTGTTSGVLHVDVEYGPRNTSVSVTPSTETLICHSHANPAVENYTWFKIYNDHISAAGHQRELHLKKHFQGDHNYFCMATNKYGSHNSSTVLLRGKVYWWTGTTDQIAICTSIAALLIVVTVVAIRRQCTKTTESQENENENTHYCNYPVVDMSQSQEEEVMHSTIIFESRTKACVEQKMDSTNDDDCTIYSTLYSHHPVPAGACM